MENCRRYLNTAEIPVTERCWGCSSASDSHLDRSISITFDTWVPKKVYCIQIVQRFCWRSLVGATNAPIPCLSLLSNKTKEQNGGRFNWSLSVLVISFKRICFEERVAFWVRYQKRTKAGITFSRGFVTILRGEERQTRNRRCHLRFRFRDSRNATLHARNDAVSRENSKVTVPEHTEWFLRPGKSVNAEVARQLAQQKLSGNYPGWSRRRKGNFHQPAACNKETTIA